MVPAGRKRADQVASGAGLFVVPEAALGLRRLLNTRTLDQRKEKRERTTGREAAAMIFFRSSASSRFLPCFVCLPFSLSSL